MPQRASRILRAGLLLGVIAGALPAVAQERPGEAPAPEVPPGQPPTVHFSLQETKGEAGSLVNVPFFLRTDTPLAMAAFSVDYDPKVLEFLAPRLSDFVADLLVRIPDADWRFDWYVNPDEGWVQVSLVVDYQGREEFSLPPSLFTSAAFLQFHIKEGVKRGRTHLRFTRPDAARYRGHFADGERPVYNAARRHGRPFTPNDQFHDGVVPDLEDGAILISIIGDVGIFLRGDVNVDSTIDVSDPVALLNFLFLGDREPDCEDAADGNDDGILDIADPIAILEYLFLSTSSSSQFSGLPAEDETPDALGCAAPAP
jgi:hypothetical protein